jgi:hypothetical protein
VGDDGVVGDSVIEFAMSKLVPIGPRLAAQARPPAAETALISTATLLVRYCAIKKAIVAWAGAATQTSPVGR